MLLKKWRKSNDAVKSEVLNKAPLEPGINTFPYRTLWEKNFFHKKLFYDL